MHKSSNLSRNRNCISQGNSDLSHCKVNLTYLSKHKVWKMIKSTRFFRYLVLKYIYAHQKLRLNRIEYCNIWCSSCFIGTDVFARKCLLFFHLTQAKIKNGFLCTPTDPTKLPLLNTFFNCLILIFTKIDCPCHIINTLSFCINKYWISLTFLL